jgi:uncharacterized protein (DUF1778 family)
MARGQGVTIFIHNGAPPSALVGCLVQHKGRYHSQDSPKGAPLDRSIKQHWDKGYYQYIHDVTPDRDRKIFWYVFIPYAIVAYRTKEVPMPRALTDNGRVELRLRPEDKAMLTRAASLKRLDLTGYILRSVLPQAQADISEAERLTLSERDSLRVLALLENPPPAPDRLVRAAKLGFTLP